jgi:hypothetical protein
MALRQAGLIFRAEAAGSLAISPRSGEAFRVRRIFTANHGGTLQHVTVINDTSRVGFFRLIGLGGSHLLNPREQETSGNLRGTNMLDYMSRQIGFKGYPVVQGETLTLSLDNSTADIYAVADSYDPGDVQSTEQCGSKAGDVLYMNYGTNLSNVTATGYNKLDNRRNPAEMVAFPFGVAGSGLVPAGKKVHIYLIGGQPMGRFTSGGNTASNNYIRPRIGTVPGSTVFDRSDVGVPFLGTTPGASTDYTSVRSGVPSNPWAIDPTDQVLAEMDFNPNDELSLQVLSTIVGTGQITAGDIDVWALQRVSPA